MHQMYQQNQALQQQVQALQQVVSQPAAAPAAAPAAPAHRALPKLPSPATFRGEMGRAVDEWRGVIEQHLEYYAIPEGMARITFATACFSGAATQWWQHLPAEEKAGITTWAALVDKLHQRFRPVQASMIARQQLDRLRQRAGQSVNAYANLFQSILTQVDDMSASDQKFIFLKGLHSSIAAKVYERQPQDLTAAVNAAVTVEAMMNYGRSASSSGSYFYNQRHSSSAHSSSSSSAPMDINHLDAEYKYDSGDESGQMESDHRSADPLDAILSRLESMNDRINAIAPGNSFNRNRNAGNAQRSDMVRGLAPGEIERRKANGQCFRCGARGHMKRECPQARRPFH